MKPNVFCESRPLRTEHQSRFSKHSTDDENATERRKAGTIFPAGSPAAVNPDVANAAVASSGRHQRSSELARRTAVPGEISWGLLAAFTAALASAGFLLAMASTGGIYLD